MVALQHLLDPAIEPFDHAVGLRMLRRGQTMFDATFCAEQVELVPAGGAALVQTEQAVGELLAIIGEDGADTDRADPFQVAQEAAGVGGSLGATDPDKDPAGRPVDGHEQVAA